MENLSKILYEKAMKMKLPNSPLERKLKQSNDYIESMKIILEFMGDTLEKFSKPILAEGIKDDFSEECSNRIYSLSLEFQSAFVKFSQILKKNITPLSIEGRAAVNREMALYWEKLSKQLEKAKSHAKQLQGRATMLWDSDDFKSNRKFIERLMNTNINDIKTRMMNAEFPLGDDIVSYEE